MFEGRVYFDGKYIWKMLPGSGDGSPEPTKRPFTYTARTPSSVNTVEGKKQNYPSVTLTKNCSALRLGSALGTFVWDLRLGFPLSIFAWDLRLGSSFGGLCMGPSFGISFGIFRLRYFAWDL